MKESDSQKIKEIVEVEQDRPTPTIDYDDGTRPVSRRIGPNPRVDPYSVDNLTRLESYLNEADKIALPSKNQQMAVIQETESEDYQGATNDIDEKDGSSNDSIAELIESTPALETDSDVEDNEFEVEDDVLSEGNRTKNFP